MDLKALLLFALPVSLAAQVPAGWNARPWLGADRQEPGPWFGAGLWSADAHGPTATFVDTLGLGNALRGGGIQVEAGLKAGNWDLAAKFLGVRDQKGAAYLTLHQGHLAWRSAKGWSWSLEQEPLIWGYGLNGGYILGEAARPFPRFRMETPMAPLHIFSVPLGTWGAQVFVGRLENHRVLSDSVQDPVSRQNAIARLGDPQAPMIHGYRLQARFGDLIEFYVNYANQWSGTLNGRGQTEGYGVRDYLTAMFGAKDALAEANFDPNDPNRPPGAYWNEGRSASEADSGIRVRLPILERAFSANQVHGYISRGSKNTYWAPALMRHKPLYYLGKDLERDVRQLFHAEFSKIWNLSGRYSVPNLVEPNDTFGLLIAWPGLRLGLEYADFMNPYEFGIRPFVHSEYRTGFYAYGDPLGNAIAGEARTATARLEWDLSERLASTTWVNFGTRAFRDKPEEWQAAFPGERPGDDSFLGLQQVWRWQSRGPASLSVGASWQRHSAVTFVQGRSGNGFRWFTELGFRWPGH